MRERRQLLLTPLTLFGFALAQPLFDLLGRQPMFLLEHEVAARELAALVILSWIAPGCAVGFVALALYRIRPSVATISLLPWIALLVAATVLPLVSALPGRIAPFAVAGTLGALAAVAYARWHGFRRALAVGIVAPIVFSAVFVLRPSTRSVVFSSPDTAAVESAGSGSLRPLVLVVFDEIPTSSLLRQRHEIDPERYPHFAALQRESIWFRNAYTVSGATHRALPAILTGNYVRDDTAPTTSKYPQNLLTLLEGRYEPFVCETATRLAPSSMGTTLPSLHRQRLALLVWDCGVLWLHRILPQATRQALPPVDDRWVGFGRKVPHRPGHPGRFLDWVDNLENSRRPMLAFIHVQFPHNPYNYYPNGKKHSHRNVEPHRQGGRWTDDVWPVQQSWQRSLLQLQYADALLGKLVARLRELGVYDEAVLAVTADHGVSFRAGDFQRRLSSTNFMDILPVPLLLKLPGAERSGAIDERLMANIDLLPTLAEACGFDIPWPCDGLSMHDPGAPGREEALFYDPIGNDVLRRYRPEQLAQSDSTRRGKLELFGQATGPWRDFAFGPHAALLGRPLTDFAVGEASELTAYLRQTGDLADVDFAAEMVPGELRGEVESPAASERRHSLAIALRDSIVAVTQSVLDEPGSSSQDWLALLPFARLQPGRNDVALYEIADSIPPQLNPIPLDDGMPSFVGRQLATMTHERVGTSGFYEPFTREGAVRRWTDGEARLIVPQHADDPPRTLRLDIHRSSPDGTRLTLHCAGALLFEGPIPPGPWRRDFPLPALARGGTIEIQISSTPFVPAELDSNETDNRRLGVLLNGLWLLADQPGQMVAPARR